MVDLTARVKIIPHHNTSVVLEKEITLCVTEEDDVEEILQMIYGPWSNIISKEVSLGAAFVSKNYALAVLSR